MVRRRFPETVEIILTERVPVAHWRAGGLVDSGQGTCLPQAWKQDLPIFEGAAGDQAKTWSNIMRTFPVF